MCPALRSCRHDCENPGWVQYIAADGVPQWRLSGKVTLARVHRELEELKAETRLQQYILFEDDPQCMNS
jgi:hypothetical protein